MRLAENYGKLPLNFEANEEQTDPSVKFLSRGYGYTLFLTSDEAVLNLQRETALLDSDHQTTMLRTSAAVRPDDAGAAVLRMKLVGASLTARISASDEQAGKSNYFRGNDPGKWRTNVPNFAKVRYRNIYRGIDLVYYGNQQQLEYDFVVAPGADARAITLELTTDSSQRLAAPLSIAKNGDLLVPVEGSEIRFHRPTVYQGERSALQHTLGGSSKAIATQDLVAAHWVLKSPTQVGFEVGVYDRTRPLIIDPALSYSTYLGGTKSNTGYNIALDSAGNAYVTGSTFSTDFPTKKPYQKANAGKSDAFVAKINSTGTALVYSTYLGGSGVDFAFGIAVDASGDAYVAGTTGSANFPVTAGAFQTKCGGGCLQGTPDGFISKLNPAGSALLYSTFLGGSGDDRLFALAVDSAGDAFVTGKTKSSDFPTTSGAFQTVQQGIINVFVSELNPAGSALVYSTYLGGSSTDQANALAVTSNGNAYVSGSTNSTNFPTTSGAFQTTLRGAVNAFVTGVNPTGSGLVYSTYLGGSATDVAWGLKVDSSGNAYVAGQTISADFPATSGAFQTTCPAACAKNSAFVTKVNPTGSALVFSTFLGGTGEQEAFALALDPSGQAYVTGRSNASDYPTTPGAFLTSNAGSFDAIVTVLDPGGSALLYSTYLGGSKSDNGLGITATAGHRIYLTGRTYSPDFPITPGALEPACNTCGPKGNDAAFVAKLVPGDQVWPLALDFGDEALGGTTSPKTATLTNSSGKPLNISTIALGGANSEDFSQSNNCGSVLAVKAFCTITVTFTPSAAGRRSAAVTITDDAANNPQSVALSGTGTAASLTPASLNFGTLLLGTSSPSQPATLTNHGTTGLTITSIATSSPYTETNNCGSSLAAGASCTINVVYTATAVGTQNGTLSVQDDATQMVPLTGIGTAITLSPASVNFGNQAKGTSSAPQAVTMSNIGTSNVTIGTIAIAGLRATSYSQTNTCGTSLGAGASCTISVIFTPLATGPLSAQIRISDNGGGSPQIVPLSGNGT
jgi:hypothetical protein